MHVFTELGRLEKPYHIEIDPTGKTRCRTTPAALRERVKAELDNMEKRELI